MNTKIVLVDVNTKVVRAFRDAFEGARNVEVVSGSLLTQKVDAWVSPTNSLGNMDGGLDALIRARLGVRIQARVKAEIASQFGGFLPVGSAVCVPTGRMYPSYLISTPTMTQTSQNISATLNTALACCAAFQAVAHQNRYHAAGIRSVAVPGLGTGTGRVTPELCADLMWTAFNLFADREFEDFASVRLALEAEVGSVGSVGDDASWVQRAQAYRDGCAAHA
jgi:O-acetyl-ADP-ribose deacetylase (regulator of RNase III)